MGPAARVLWIPRHEPLTGCWCRPRILEVAGGYVVRHRMINVRPDPRHRAFVPLRYGVPS